MEWAWAAFMCIYVVALSLRGTDHDYAPLWAALDRAGSQRVMDTTWLVDVKDDVHQLTVGIQSLITDTDTALVVAMGAAGGWSATRVDDDTKTWLSRRLATSAAPPDRRPFREPRLPS